MPASVEPESSGPPSEPLPDPEPPSVPGMLSPTVESWPALASPVSSPEPLPVPAPSRFVVLPSTPPSQRDTLSTPTMELHAERTTAHPTAMSFVCFMFQADSSSLIGATCFRNRVAWFALPVGGHLADLQLRDLVARLAREEAPKVARRAGIA